MNQSISREVRIQNALVGLEAMRDEHLPALRGCLLRCLEAIGNGLSEQVGQYSPADEMAKALSHLANLESIAGRSGSLREELATDGAYPFGPSEAPPAPKEPRSAVRAAEPEVDDVLSGVDYARQCLELLIREAGPELARIAVCECETTARALPESGALRHLRALELVSMALAHLQYAEESASEQESEETAA